MELTLQASLASIQTCDSCLFEYFRTLSLIKVDWQNMLLDLFPLNSVVFPHQTMSLRIFEPRYLKLIETCYRDASPFGICMIREGKWI